LFVTLGNRTCVLQKPIGQGAFAVVNVRYNTKISNMVHIKKEQ